MPHEGHTSSFRRQLPRRILIALATSGLGWLAWHESRAWIRGAVPLRSLPKGANLATELIACATAVAHTWIDRHPAEELDWNWREGVLMFGIEHAQQALNDRKLLEYSRRYLAHHLACGIHLQSSDDTTPGLAAVERSCRGDRQFSTLASQVAEYHLRAPRSASGLILHLGSAYPSFVRSRFPDAWVDSLFCFVPMLMRYSAYSGDARFENEAARQLLAFARVLSDPASHLVTHAYEDSPGGGPVPPFDHHAFWARGNGWMLVSLVDALEHLPTDHGARTELVGYAKGLEAALRAVQRPTGLFGTLLQDPDSYEETAGSALILYAMARGARLGLFDDATRVAAERGGRGLWAVVRRRGPEAQVTGTSLGTNPIEALYARTPTADQVSYGVGAWLLAAVEIARLLENGSGAHPGSGSCDARRR